MPELCWQDLKSPNILLGRDLTAKIADVGLARSISTDAMGLSQMTAVRFATVACAAPGACCTPPVCSFGAVCRLRATGSGVVSHQQCGADGHNGMGSARADLQLPDRG